MFANACRLVVLTLVCVPAIAQSSWLFTPPANQTAFVRTVSDTGEILGWSRFANSTNGVMFRASPAAPLQTGPATRISAADAASGAIVSQGNAYTTPPWFIWNRDDTITNLPAYPFAQFNTIQSSTITSVSVWGVSSASGVQRVFGFSRSVDDTNPDNFWQQQPWVWTASTGYRALPTLAAPGEFAQQGVIRVLSASGTTLGGCVSLTSRGQNPVPALCHETASGWQIQQLPPPAGFTYSPAREASVTSLSADGSAAIAVVPLLDANNDFQSRVVRWDAGVITQSLAFGSAGLPATFRARISGDAAFTLIESGTGAFSEHLLLWRSGESTALRDSFAQVGILLPEDALLRDIVLSPDGRTFAGQLSSVSQNLTNVVFVATIPSPAALPLLAFSLLAVRRRRRP